MSLPPDLRDMMLELPDRTNPVSESLAAPPPGSWPPDPAEEAIFDEHRFDEHRFDEHRFDEHRGVIAQNAEIHRLTQEQAVLQERQRLADNLHDAVNQSLFSAGLIAEVLPRLWERSPEEGMRALQDLRRLTRCALAEMRILVADLRPSAIMDTDIADLLHLLGNALAGRADIPVTVTVAGAGPLPADLQVGIYRLCQEWLSRIAKHPGATRVDIDLRYEAGTGSLRIHDDGMGFEAENGASAREALVALRERAATMGAELAIDSRAGQWTDFTVRWRDLPAQ